jgi:taurine dioxygenase
MEERAMVRFEVRNLIDAFGAVVTGLDLTKEFDDETRASLRKIFYERGALVFRGLDIDTVCQDRLCRMLCGDDERDAGQRNPQYVSNTEPGGAAPYGRLLYHGDMMWHPKPFEVLSLYGQKVEPGAATTSLASGVVGWERLPAHLRAKVENLRALNVTGTVFSRGGDDLLRAEREHEVETVKPVKIIHPRTGKPILYVSQQNTRKIVELGAEESEALLQELFSHLYAPEVVYEHTWEKGDLLVFDNIAMQHARSNVELNGPKRTLRKVIAPVPKVEMEAPAFEKTRQVVH